MAQRTERDGDAQSGREDFQDAWIRRGHASTTRKGELQLHLLAPHTAEEPPAPGAAATTTYHTDGAGPENGKPKAAGWGYIATGHGAPRSPPGFVSTPWSRSSSKTGCLTAAARSIARGLPPIITDHAPEAERSRACNCSAGISVTAPSLATLSFLTADFVRRLAPS